jgi:DNA-binding NarL/FixJ family response regulator
MDKPARAIMTDGTVRVRLRLANAARADALAKLLRELGYAVGNSSDADLVLSETASNALYVIAEDGSGALGVLQTDASPPQIDAALRAVAAGLSVHAPHHEGFSALEEHEAPSPLTPRELEILIALSDGLSNKAIARRFDISQHTVKFHAESIFRKLGATTRADAVAKGLRQGIVHL